MIVCNRLTQAADRFGEPCPACGHSPFAHGGASTAGHTSPCHICVLDHEARELALVLDQVRVLRDQLTEQLAVLRGSRLGQVAEALARGATVTTHIPSEWDATARRIGPISRADLEAM